MKLCDFYSSNSVNSKQLEFVFRVSAVCAILANPTFIYIGCRLVHTITATATESLFVKNGLN